MRLSILLRGKNFSETDRFGVSMDGRKNIDSLMERLIDPIRAMSPDAKVYLATYDSPALEDIKARIGPCETILIDPANSSQAETYKEGLKHVFGKNDYDALVVSRFDLEFKQNFNEWPVAIDADKIFFPWKEYLKHWRDHHRVGDAVHIIGRNALSKFHSSIIMSQLAGRNHMHLAYYYLRTMHPHLHFIHDGYWDSNTLFANPECNNPLYRIFNRPRLSEISPSTGMFLEEIRAE